MPELRGSDETLAGELKRLPLGKRDFTSPRQVLDFPDTVRQGNKNRVLLPFEVFSVLAWRPS